MLAQILHCALAEHYNHLNGRFLAEEAWSGPPL